MTEKTFKALLVEEAEEGSFTRRIVQRSISELPPGDVLVRVRYSVGGPFLACALKSTRFGGAVTTCGNVASPDLSLTVYPFILRGISLFGIAAAECPDDVRREIWRRLAGEWKLPGLETFCREISLEDLDWCIERMLQGESRGRVLINMNG